jgi:integrase
MGSVYKRGQTYWVKYYRNGKCIRESSGSTKMMVAKKFLARKEGDIAQGKFYEVDFSKVIFNELAEDFLMDYEINGKKSLVRAKRSLEHLLKEFSGARVIDITTAQVQNVYIQNRKKWTCKKCGDQFHVGADTTCPKCGSSKLQKGAANATINRELAALRRILNLGAKQTPPKVNRVPYIPMLKENNVRKGFFEHEQFVAMRNELPEYLKFYVTFGYKVGWRYQEIASLTWANVDLGNGIVTLKVGETKNNEARTVYLDQELKEMFEQQWERRKQYAKIVPYVFPNQDGTGKIGNFRRAWNTACRKIGMGYGYKLQGNYVEKWESKFPPGPTFHDLRRTAVRNMVRAGVPERVAMMVSGHKTRSVFDRYNIVNDSDLKMASARQEAYLKNQMGTILGTISVFQEKVG